MNEPKRRGRPTNAEKAAREAARVDLTAEVTADVTSFDRAPFVAAAQAYALRVWNGQSPDVPRNERIRRVKLALEGQNLPFEGVELP